MSFPVHGCGITVTLIIFLLGVVCIAEVPCTLYLLVESSLHCSAASQVKDITEIDIGLQLLY